MDFTLIYKGLIVPNRIMDGACEELNHYGQFLPSVVRIIHAILISGIELARLADLPADVLSEAKRVAEQLSSLQARNEESRESHKVSIRRKALLRVDCNFFYFPQ